MRALFPFLTIAALVAGPAFGQQQPGPSPRAGADPATARVLAEARRLQEQMSRAGGTDDTLSARFREVVRSALPSYPEVQPTIGDGAPFRPVRLNVAGQGFDAIRFRTPPGGPWDLHWEFIAPTDAIRGWYLIAAEGEVEGFTSFDRRQDVQVPGLDLPAENIRIIQSLPGGKLEAGEQYLIWFHLGDASGPVDYHIALALSRPGQGPAPPPNAPRLRP